MSDQEILSAAMKIAIDNGWDCPSLIRALYLDSTKEIKGQSVEMVRGVITSHDFVKALWDNLKLCKNGHEMSGGDIYCRFGDGPTTFPCGAERTRLESWQLKLQQLVLAHDPIKYLADNLPEAKS